MPDQIYRRAQHQDVRGHIENGGCDVCSFALQTLPWVLRDPYLGVRRVEIDEYNKIDGVEQCIDNGQALHEPPEYTALDGQKDSQDEKKDRQLSE